MEKYKIEDVSETKEPDGSLFGSVTITRDIQIWYGLINDPNYVGCKTKSEALELASVICSLLNSQDENPGV